jgi:hypothetical protein
MTGFGLMALKYGFEAVAVRSLTGLSYTPLDFINPLISTRERFAQGAPEWFGLLWVIWTLPFLWIALSMSVRRALDAGFSPWFGLAVLVPGLNIPAMLFLAFAPSKSEQVQVPVDRTGPAEQHPPVHPIHLLAVLAGIAAGAVYATAMIQFNVLLVDDYGASLFFGTPFVTGAAAGYVLNFRESRSWSVTVASAAVAVICSGMALLLFAAEGAICLLMAAPIMLPLGMAGGPVGKFIADQQRGLRRGLMGCLIILPLFAAVESKLPNNSEFVVVSSVTIAAPPAIVWERVISFTDIAEPPDWFFRLGISCPIGATIDGTGVGAVRECIFTTGKFVEPITAWDEPRRLAFDVREQPEPMIELTPYRHIHPPHLDGAFRSTRGEFELIALEDGRTQLIGRTWYTLDMRPHAYWTIWSDWLVHRIHGRVLRHIKRTAEQESARFSQLRGV